MRSQRGSVGGGRSDTVAAMTKPIVFVLVSVALATACGGKSKGGAAPPPGGAAGANDPATPFDDAAVQAAIANMSGLESCGAEPTTTMGAHFAAQREGLMSGGSGGTAVDEAFACTAQEEGQWECQWSVFTKPSAPDPEDPCAEGGGGSGYIIVARVNADGALVPDQIFCNAPG